MMRASQQRVFVALVATVIGLAVGALTGYWLGRAIVKGQAEGRLDQQATRILLEGETSKAGVAPGARQVEWIALQLLFRC